MLEFSSFDKKRVTFYNILNFLYTNLRVSYRKHVTSLNLFYFFRYEKIRILDVFNQCHDWYNM